MRTPLNCRKGQAIVLVTFSLFAMAGLMGLVVDLGWSYFVRKSAQSAADAAALAAAQEALRRVGAAAAYTCGTSGNTTPYCSGEVTCDTITDPNNNLYNACQYATRNGFQQGGNGGRQRVSIQANVTTPIPTAPGVNDVRYWVTVRVAQSIPQLFSAVLGNTQGLIAARATAAVARTESFGSLRLTNRQGDCLRMNGGNKDVCGVDLQGQANTNQGLYSVDAAGGILMASNCSGQAGTCTGAAGEIQGGTYIHAPFTYIRGSGNYTTSNNATWQVTPVNGQSEGSEFQDPTTGLSQPPLPSSALNGCEISGGVIAGSNDPGTPSLLGPFNYYATQQLGSVVTATGNPIQIQGNVKFTSTGTCPGVLVPAGTNPAGSFGTYIFHGGVKLAQTGQGGMGVTFDPGMYVLDGVQHNTNGGANPLFDASAGGNTTIQSSGSGDSFAGQMFVFTAPGYPGMATQIAAYPKLGVVAPLLFQGTSGFQTGNNNGVTIDLWGLNRSAGALPSSLENYHSFNIWQDRRNSVTKYDSSGNIVCGNTSAACQKSSTELTTDRATTDSPELFFKASPGTSIHGTIYQPRGSWTNLQGGGAYNGPLALIAGALKVQGNANVSLLPVQLVLTKFVVALVE